MKNKDALRINKPLILEYRCPKCEALLTYFAGDDIGVEYLYCPFCNDAYYDVATGKYLGILE
jgi:Zn finger protein HypA/HybF involved in hydrogenase expression